PGGRPGVEERALIVRVHHVGPPAAEDCGELHDQARLEPARSAQRNERPALGLNVLRQLSAQADRDESKVERPGLSMARKLDEQLLLATDVEAESDMEDAAASRRICIACY